MTAAPQTFNGPLEIGVRLLALLTAVYPQAYDLQRLVGLDYLLVHSGDVGGPESLHAPVPLRSAELLVKRQLVERAIHLMASKGLVARTIDPSGIMYQAEDAAAPFLDTLSTPYMNKVKARAEWVSKQYGALTDADFRALMTKFFQPWIEQFQAWESAQGADQ